MTDIQIPVSIGFEMETQFMTPILVNNHRIKDIHNRIVDDVVYYQLHSTENDDFYLYGDAFTSTEFATLCQHFKFPEKKIHIKELYSRDPGITLQFNQFYSKLTNTEFVNTFPRDQKINLSKLWNHIIIYLRKTIENIQ